MFAKTIPLQDEQPATLVRWLRGRNTPARLVLTATIVLAAADKRANKTWPKTRAARRVPSANGGTASPTPAERHRVDAPRGNWTAATRACLEPETLR